MGKDAQGATRAMSITPHSLNMKDAATQTALAAQKRATEVMLNAGADFNYAEAAAQLAEAIVQLRLIQKLRGKN